MYRNRLTRRPHQKTLFYPPLHTQSQYMLLTRYLQATLAARVPFHLYFPATCMHQFPLYICSWIRTSPIKVSRQWVLWETLVVARQNKQYWGRQMCLAISVGHTAVAGHILCTCERFQVQSSATLSKIGPGLENTFIWRLRNVAWGQGRHNAAQTPNPDWDWSTHFCPSFQFQSLIWLTVHL